MKRSCHTREIVHWILLPIDLWMEILRYLQLADLFKCASVCATWHRVDLINKSVHALSFREARQIRIARLKKMTNLVTLELAEPYYPDRYFCANLNDALRSLINLRALDLRQVNYTINAVIGTLTNLNTLRLEGNNLDVATFLRLPNLQTLSLGKDNCTVEDSTLSHLTNLINLELAFNRTLTGESLTCLTNLTRLQLRSSVNHPYSSVSDVTLQELTNLTELIIDGPLKVTGTGLLCLPKLKTLGLYRNWTITTEDINALTSLTRLQVGAMNSISTMKLEAPHLIIHFLFSPSFD